MYLIIFYYKVKINLGDIALEQGNLKMPCTTFKKKSFLILIGRYDFKSW
jgi:hypothetical protein